MSAFASHDDFLEQASLYAFGAMDADERAAFEAAIDGDALLTAEVAELLETVAALGSAEAAAPPAALRADVLAAIEDLPQLPPMLPRAVGAVGVDEVGPAASGPAASDAGVAGFGAAPQLASERPASERRPVRSIGRRAVVGIVTAAAAAVAAIAVTVGVVLAQPTAEVRAFQELTAASDAVTVSAETADGATIDLITSAELERAGIETADLAALSADEVYQLWFIGDTGPVSAGTFEVAGDGTEVVLAGVYRPGVVVGITVEPAGGSEQPTTDPIWAAQA